MTLDPLSLAVGASLWPATAAVRHLADRYGWRMPSRIIPPPRVGRWQIVYQDKVIGRYRTKTNARLIAHSLDRRFPNTPPCQVRRTATDPKDQQ